MRTILDPLISALEQGQSPVLAGIVRNAGSAPRTSGARMLMLPNGSSIGSIGGGALEGACQAKAHELLVADSTAFAELHFNLNADSAAEAGMLCGGSVSVLLQRLDETSLPFFRQLRDDYRHGRRPLLITTLPANGASPRLDCISHREDGRIPPELRGEILRKNRRTPFPVVCGMREYFVEPLVHPGRLHLVGAGHVALAAARIAAFVGFEVIVMDDRAEFADPARFPEAREVRVLMNFDDCLTGLDRDDYVVIVTRGHMHDREVLAQALHTGAGYIGMIGSRNKRDAIYAALRGEGRTEADLRRVHCPIGLAIGADTPEEIALSIVAELVQARAEAAG